MTTQETPKTVITREQFNKLVEQAVEEKLAKIPHPGGKNIALGADEDDAERFAKRFAGGLEVEKGQAGFRGMREFLRTVATSPGDERLTSAAKAMTIGDPEAGGYLVPTEYAGQMIGMAIESGRIFPLCQSTPMKSNALKTPVAVSLDESSGEVFGGVKFAWVAEEGTKPEKEFKLIEIALEARVAAALCKSSNQLLEDSTPRAEEVIREIFSKSFAWMLDDVVVNGTGVGQPLGILSAPCLYTVAKESGQSAKTIVWKNIQKMFARLWPGSKESSALRWLINDECVEQILDLNQPVGTGGSSVIVAAGEGVRPVPSKLLGIPIVWTSHASALGAAGDVILADLSKYLVGVRKALTAAASVHKYFDTNHTLFRFEGRLDGMPIIPSTIKTRTNFETSPFITLAVRA